MAEQLDGTEDTDRAAPKATSGLAQGPGASLGPTQPLSEVQPGRYQVEGSLRGEAWGAS